MLVRGAKPMEKRPGGRGLMALVVFLLRLLPTTFITWKDPSARRRRVTERSERTVEEAEKSRR